MDTPIASMLEGMPWAIAEKPFASAAEEGERAMPTSPDTLRDAVHHAAYEFALELVRALELHTLDGAALYCGMTVEVSIDGKAPRVRLDLINTAVDLPSVGKPPACGETQNGKTDDHL